MKVIIEGDCPNVSESDLTLAPFVQQFIQP